MRTSLFLVHFKNLSELDQYADVNIRTFQTISGAVIRLSNDSVIQTTKADTSPTILLVEDDAATARVMKRLMKSVGVEVEAVATVKAGIDALCRMPAVAVLDLALPDGCGVEIIEAIRASKLRCKVAVVSGNTDPAIFARLRGAAPDAIFSKPLDFVDFVHWLCEAFPEADDQGLAA